MTFPRPQIIKKADQAVMAAVMNQLVKWPDLAQRPELPPPPKDMVIKSMGWQEVKGIFLERFQELSKEQEREDEKMKPLWMRILDGFFDRVSANSF